MGARGVRVAIRSPPNSEKGVMISTYWTADTVHEHGGKLEPMRVVWLGSVQLRQLVKGRFHGC